MTQTANAPRRRDCPCMSCRCSQTSTGPKMSNGCAAIRALHNSSELLQSDQYESANDQDRGNDEGKQGRAAQ